MSCFLCFQMPTSDNRKPTITQEDGFVLPRKPEKEEIYERHEKSSKTQNGHGAALGACHAQAYPTSWLVRVDDAQEKSVAFSITRCGLWKMCLRENCPEFCSTLCRTDYVMADFGKAALTRSSTLADGAECCDFLYIRKTTT
jgi:hypothetical protein